MPTDWRGRPVDVMPRWRVDYIDKIGSVEAADERSAIEQAAKQFKITPARLQQDRRHEARSQPVNHDYDPQRCDPALGNGQTVGEHRRSQHQRNP
jgi:hypothetical protein